MKQYVRICSIGSGSKGNSFVIDSGEDMILVDAGFSRKEMFVRLEQAGIDAKRIRAVLLTHEHDDHVKGCRLFCDDLEIPLFASYKTAEFLSQKKKLPRRVVQFEAGDVFELGSFRISPFAVQHDAIDPVGFVIGCVERRIGIATDLGELNALSYQRLCNCSALLLESNYDKDMLYQSDRQLYLKRRIHSRNGHLDNADALAGLERLLGEATRLLMLVHISSECNSLELVERNGSARLAALMRQEVCFHVARQESVSGWFEL